MDQNYYKQYEPFFGGWTITGCVGEDGLGQLFEIQREFPDQTCRCYMRAVTITEGLEELLRGYDLMRNFVGADGVVSGQEYEIHQHPDGAAWDILFRLQMPAYLPLSQLGHTLDRHEIWRLTTDICGALEMYHNGFNPGQAQPIHVSGIVHRNVSPDNIIVSDDAFLLGPPATSGQYAKAKDWGYMAPEAYRGEPYGPTVDIYALGMVLYRALNGNRLPERPASGAPLPPPRNADEHLAQVILKACACDHVDRYQNPGELRDALWVVLPAGEEKASLFGFLKRRK